MANRSHCHSLHFLSLIQGMNEGHHYLRCHFLLHSVQNLFWICIALGFCAASVSIASAGKFLAKNYTLKPKDLSTLNINIKTLNKIHLAADQVRETITEQVSRCLERPVANWSLEMISPTDFTRNVSEKSGNHTRRPLKWSYSWKAWLKDTSSFLNSTPGLTSKLEKGATNKEGQKQRRDECENDDRQRRQDPVHHRAYLP